MTRSSADYEDSFYLLQSSQRPRDSGDLSYLFLLRQLHFWPRPFMPVRSLENDGFRTMAVEWENVMRNKVQKTIEEAGNILVSTWGMLFRTLFIIAVGYFGYSWIEPQALGDKPLSQLTLNNIVSNLMAGAIVFGCIVWFFHFPTSDEHKSEPYLIWAQFGAVIVGGGILVNLFWLK